MTRSFKSTQDISAATVSTIYHAMYGLSRQMHLLREPLHFSRKEDGPGGESLSMLHRILTARVLVPLSMPDLRTVQNWVWA